MVNEIMTEFVILSVKTSGEDKCQSRLQHHTKQHTKSCCPVTHAVVNGEREDESVIVILSILKQAYEVVKKHKSL